MDTGSKIQLKRPNICPCHNPQDNAPWEKLKKSWKPQMFRSLLQAVVFTIPWASWNVSSSMCERETSLIGLRVENIWMQLQGVLAKDDALATSSPCGGARVSWKTVNSEGYGKILGLSFFTIEPNTKRLMCHSPSQSHAATGTRVGHRCCHGAEDREVLGGSSLTANGWVLLLLLTQMASLVPWFCSCSDQTPQCLFWDSLWGH